MSAVAYTKAFDLLVIFPHELEESIKAGEIYKVMYEEDRFIIKTQWKRKMSNTLVCFCTVLGDKRKIRRGAWSFLTVDRIERFLNESEKEYYDLFM